MEFKDIIFLSVLTLGTTYIISTNTLSSRSDVLNYFKNNNRNSIYSEKNNDENPKIKFAFIENNINGKRTTIRNSLEINQVNLPRVHPNYDSNIIVEEFHGKGLARTLRVKEKLPTIPSIGYWEDEEYYFADKLLYTKRKANLLSRESEIEGILDRDNSTIITDSDKEYVLVNNNGYFKYILKK
ncbi:MAG: hypothetical protein PF569_00965 [Candidatus Woesearchaeota archaeon]|jgi:hypothetical protein|nr:hypothetical protein [Candidatus Woesearchaeota archaeon]